MSEYQRYEFMTIDRPLTRVQLDAVNALSSHIEASSTHALIEYHWGDFKHDPIKVLRQFFDGYDLDDFVTFTRYPDYDILDIHFGEMEGPDEWIDYELGSLIPIRDELMEGDLRALYIVWLAGQHMIGGYDEDEEEDEEEDY